MILPTPVQKPPFAITRASHVLHRVRDLAASRAFYVDLLGRAVSDEDAETVWLRGLEEGCPHSLVLKSGEAACEQIGMRVLTEDDLERAKAHFAGAGFPTAWVEVPHQGRTFHTTDTAGMPLEFCETMETPPRLFHHLEVHRIAGAHRLDYVQVITPFVPECLNFYAATGFRLSEYVVEGQDDLLMVFLQRMGNPNDIVFAKGAGPCLHHMTYTVPETQSLILAADLFARAGCAAQVEFGPARHFSPGLARFLYLCDPDGHRIELFPSYYQTIDIEDEPLRWHSPDFQIGGWQTPPARLMDRRRAARPAWSLSPSRLPAPPWYVPRSSAARARRPPPECAA